MLTHRGFLADIIAHPEDDEIRMIYADWLEDHASKEYAEFIRLHVGGHRPAAPALTAAGRQFLFEYGTQLYAEFSPLPVPAPKRPPAWLIGPDTTDDHFYTSDIQYVFRVVGKGGVQFHVRRGFPERVVCPLTYWATHGQRIAAAHPITRVIPNDVAWYFDGIDRRRWEIIIEHLEGSIVTFLQAELNFGCATIDELHAATSRALLKWARQ